MESLNEIKLLHESVQGDIFGILVRHNIIAHVSSTVESKAPLYFIAEEYQFMFYEIPSEVYVYLNSINRLLETGYLYILSDTVNQNYYLATKVALENLTEDERIYFTTLSEKNFSNVLQKHPYFSFLDEIL